MFVLKISHHFDYASNKTRIFEIGILKSCLETETTFLEESNYIVVLKVFPRRKNNFMLK